MLDIEKLFKIEIKNIGHGVSSYGLYDITLLPLMVKGFFFCGKCLLLLPKV